jgi:uncharacterized membrane protein
MMNENVSGMLIEFAIVGFGVVILGAYHHRMWVRRRDRPESTVMGQHALVRAAWSKAAERGGLVVVQAMRNAIMAATFLASTSVLLSGGLLAAAFNSAELPQLHLALNFLGMQSHAVWMLKVQLLVANFLLAFFNFSLAMRSFIYIGLMANIGGGDGEEADFHPIANEMERGALHYSLGIHGFYFAIPLAFWFIGPVWMLLGCVLLVAVMKWVD